MNARPTLAWTLTAILAILAASPAGAQETQAPSASEPEVVTPPAQPAPPAASAPGAAPQAAAPTTPAPPEAGANKPPVAADAAEKNAQILSAIAALAPMIGDVQIVGPWVDGTRQGVWRTIMTQSPGETSGNRFFVQQIEEKDGVSAVLSSTEVNEIADLNGAIVGYRADAPAEGQESNLTLFFDIVPLDGEISETYELFVAPNEPYRFGPASN